MTLLLITGNGAAGWWVGQHARAVRPTCQAVNDERWGHWWKKEGKKIMVEGKDLTAPESDWRETGFRLGRTQNDQQGWMISTQSLQTVFILFVCLFVLFFYCSFSKEQRWSTDSVVNEVSGNICIRLWYQVEIWRHVNIILMWRPGLYL